jgi:large conductance mechanosensitive channel
MKEYISSSKSLIQEFKEFISKGNVIDLAVGVIIGTAFGRIVTSIVEDIIMPPLGVLIGGVNFADLKLVIKGEYVVDGVTVPAVTINYGNFLQITFNFLIVAAAVFLFVKVINRLRRENKAKEMGEENQMKNDQIPEPEEVVLLREIRDALRK